MTRHDPRERDPRFPDRPTHEDYITLSELVQATDREAEVEHRPIPEIVGVDMPSILYFIENRLGTLSNRLMQEAGPADRGRLISLNLPKNPMFMSIYLDAFTLGKRFAETRALDRAVEEDGEPQILQIYRDLSEAYNRIDDEVTKYQHEQASAERTLGNIAAIIADHESGEEI